MAMQKRIEEWIWPPITDAASAQKDQEKAYGLVHYVLVAQYLSLF